MKELLKNLAEKLSPFFLIVYRYLGGRIFFLYALSILVGFLDALGITLMVPILKIADTKINPETEKDIIIKVVYKIMNFLGQELSILNVLIFVCIIFALKGALKFTLNYYKGYLRSVFTRKIRQDLISSFFKLKYVNYINANVGSITNTLTSEVITISGSFLYFNNTLISVFAIAAYMYLALLSNPLFTAGALLSGLIVSLLMRRITKNAKSISKELAKSNAEFSGLLIQLIQNFKYLKTTGNNLNFETKILKNIKKLQLLLNNLGLNQSFSSSLREPISIFLVCVIIFIQVSYLGNTVSSILVSLLLFYRVLSEILQLQNNWQIFIAGYGAQDSVKTLMKEFKQNSEVIKHSSNRIKFNKSIVLSNINFSFPNGNQVLKGINIEIPKNSTVAFVGESGSGKSTILDIISGILIPQQGSVKVDGADIHKDIQLSDWRKGIGFIAQESVVFSDTVFNNITLWGEQDDPAVIQRANYATEKAHCDTFINRLDNRLDTYIGDRGIKLSGGQRQRLSIARELYKNVELLVLDEATSALDSEAESYIKANIDELKGDMTILMVAHRLSTVKNVDLIYVLNNGELVESGTYKSLIENENGYFNKMVKLQEL